MNAQLNNQADLNQPCHLYISQPLTLLISKILQADSRGTLCSKEIPGDFH